MKAEPSRCTKDVWWCIHIVTENGMPQCGHMHTQLVASTSARFQPNHRARKERNRFNTHRLRNALKPRFNMPLGLTWATVFMADDLLGTSKHLFPQGQVHFTGVTLHQPSHAGDVRFVYLSGFEGHAQATMGGRVSCQHHHATGVTVQAMHNASTRITAGHAGNKAIGLVWSDARHAQKSAGFFNNNESRTLFDHSIAIDQEWIRSGHDT